MNNLKKIIFFCFAIYNVSIYAQSIKQKSNYIQNNIRKLDSLTKHAELEALKKIIQSDSDRYYYFLAEAAVLSSEDKLKEAVSTYYEALRISDKFKSDTLKATVYAKLGLMYLNRDNLTKGLSHLNYAFKFLRENKSDSVYVALRSKKALIFMFMKNTSEYKREVDWLLNVCTIQKSRIQEASIYNIAGNYFLDEGLNDSARYFFQKSLILREKIKYLPFIGQSYNNIGTTYFNQTNYSMALRYFQEGLMWRIKGKSPYAGVVESYINIGKTYFKLQNKSLADQYLKKSFYLSDSIKNPSLIQRASMVLKDINYDLGEYKKAMDYLVFYYKITDSLYGIKKKDEVANLTLDYETDQKLTKDSLKRMEAERDVKFEQEKQKEISKRTTIIIGLLVLFLIVVAFFTLKLFKRNKEKQIQNELITKQHDLLHQKQIEINDSINYAKNIQNALLPSGTAFDKNCNEHFVFFEPKDVVSGDFYWASRITDDQRDLFIYITADCTGHGVPGAFMSLICISFINEIIDEEKITDPAEIFNVLRKKIIQTLSQKENKNQDGLDGTVCVFDYKTKKLNYACANGRFFVGHKNADKFDVVEYRGDKMAVGKSPNEEIQFKTYSVQLQTGEIIYTFTDGMADQFGGDQNKKLKVKNLQKKISEISHFSLKEQQTELKHFFDEWKGRNEQIDDVTLIAIKV